MGIWSVSVDKYFIALKESWQTKIMYYMVNPLFPCAWGSLHIYDIWNQHVISILLLSVKLQLYFSFPFRKEDLLFWCLPCCLVRPKIMLLTASFVHSHSVLFCFPSLNWKIFLLKMWNVQLFKHSVGNSQIVFPFFCFLIGKRIWRYLTFFPWVI